MRRSNSTGIMALFVVGAYYVYKNRFQIQQFLESKGVKTNLDSSNFGNTLRSGVAKVTGKIQHGRDEASRDLRQVG